MNRMIGMLYAGALLACGEPAQEARPTEPTPAPAAAPQLSAATSDSGNAPPMMAAPVSTEPARAPAPADTAGHAAMPMTPSAASPQPTLPAVVDHHGDLRGLCQWSSGYADDHACIPAPPPGEGMQLHVGPSRYDDPREVAKYLLRPGEESSECFVMVTPNDRKMFYQSSVLSARSGTHHIINSMFAAPSGDVVPTACTEQGLSSPNRIGALPGASKPFMARRPVAPEYAHVGHSIPAHARIESELHHYNTSDKDIVREYWLNIYFAKEEDIQEESMPIAGLGGLTWNLLPIQPGTDKVYSYTCAIRGEGHILSLLGHYHAHGRRFSASIQRAAGGTEKVFEMYGSRPMIASPRRWSR